MKFILTTTMSLLVAGAASAQTGGMPINPMNSQPGTSMPMNSGATVPVPLNGGINNNSGFNNGLNNGMTQVPQTGNSATIPPAGTPAPGPSAYP